MQPTASGNKEVKKNLLVYFVFLIISLILFAPVLNKNFASDDYAVLYRIVYKKSFFISDFFRPLSDISLYGSYLTGGFNPLYYNACNVIIHASCAFILYKVCLINQFLIVARVQSFALVAAVLFLIYPFHNEAIVWAIGRGIVLSGFFGFLLLLILFTKLPQGKKYFLASLFYLIGLLGYETILPLPIIALLLLYAQNKTIKNLLPLAAGFMVAFCINIIMRVQLSGALLGSYGHAVFSPSAGGYGIKFLKATGRLLLPPSPFSVVLNSCFALLVAGLIVAAVFIKKKRNMQFAGFTGLSIITFISYILPAIFGISTRTYEGDRVFYFSSFFVCIWVSYLLSLLKSRTWWWCTSTCIIAYFLFFFYQSILTWRKSGIEVGNILTSVSNVPHAGKKLYVINMPEEYNGAQVFRNGFKEALLVSKIDTAGVVVVNYLNTEYARQLSGNIAPVNQQGVFIAPGTIIRNDSIIARVSAYKNDSIRIEITPGDKVCYWNKTALVLFENAITKY